MKKTIVPFLIVALFINILPAIADSGLPDGIDVFYVEGKVCVSNGYGLECWCPDECGAGPVCPTYVPTDKPKDPTPTDKPDDPTPTFTPVPPTPTPTPEPTEEPKAKCNRGIGNGSENCDPGNSYGQGQGGGRPAGEDRDE